MTEPAQRLSNGRFPRGVHGSGKGAGHGPGSGPARAYDREYGAMTRELASDSNDDPEAQADRAEIKRLKRRVKIKAYDALSRRLDEVAVPTDVIREALDRTEGPVPTKQELTGRDGDPLIPALSDDQRAAAVAAMRARVASE